MLHILTFSFELKRAQLFLKLDVKFKRIMMNGTHILIRFYVLRFLIVYNLIFFCRRFFLLKPFLPYWMLKHSGVQTVCILNQFDHILSAINVTPKQFLTYATAYGLLLLYLMKKQK